MFSSSLGLLLTIYCDSDWPSCHITHRSLTVFVVMLGNFLVDWKTNKQYTVSHSSAEAAFCAMAAALCEVM